MHHLAACLFPRRILNAFFLITLGVVASETRLHAASIEDRDIRLLTDDFLHYRPSTALDAVTLTRSDALSVQRRFVRELELTLGKPAGYKAGLVTPESQARMGGGPMRGVLLRKMLRKDNAVIAISDGTRLVAEADLVVTVKDNGINGARTLMEVAQHLKEVVAFIEVPDNPLATNRPVDARRLEAVNGAARLGVLGQRRAVQATSEFVDAFGKMTIVLTDQTGVELGRGKADQLLTHPLNVVLWLINDLKAHGESLRKGDILSLGAVKMISPRPGQELTLRYEGLPGGPLTARARFR